MLTRRGFIGCSTAFGAVRLCGEGLSDVTRKPLLRLGVASDVHLCRNWDQERYLASALRWFDGQGVDAVLFPGDIAHLGRISELESFAHVWDEVFPGCRGSDGRPVVRMVVTGNHEFADWPGLWDRVSEDEMRTDRLDYADNMSRTWERLFGERFEPIWRKEIKGVTFIGRQWRELARKSTLDIEAYMRLVADELPKGRPFFYCQHAHPDGTCYDSIESFDRGASYRALSCFPNAVALSGHSHNSVVDDRSVWQGAFTSIGCGCVQEGGSSYRGYENALAPYWPSYKTQRMRCLPAFGNEGRCCLMMDVYPDGLIVRRRSLQWDESLGEDWKIDVPAVVGGRFDFSRCRRTHAAPQFPSGSQVKVEVCQDPPNAGPGLKNRKCVRISFPHAETKDGSRVFDYVVRAFSNGREVGKWKVLSYGYFLPEGRSRVPGECLVGEDELPSSKIIFEVTPRNCYGTEGRSLLSWTRIGEPSSQASPEYAIIRES